MLIYAPTPLSSFPSLCPYSPYCVEGEFSEVRRYGALGSRLPVALALGASATPARLPATICVVHPT
jgi:hypothetical protein